MALTEKDKIKYNKFISNYSIEKLRKFKDSLMKDYLFLESVCKNSKTTEAKKHYSSEKSFITDKIYIIEKLIKNKQLT